VASPEYIEDMRRAVEHLHGCKAVYVRTEPITEIFRGETVWEGDVEIFDLTGHPKSKRAYAWRHKDGPADSLDRYVAVLEYPPIDSAQKAVQAAIVAEIKRNKGN
jgi:hypothetical protein